MTNRFLKVKINGNEKTVSHDNNWCRSFILDEYSREQLGYIKYEVYQVVAFLDIHNNQIKLHFLNEDGKIRTVSKKISENVSEFFYNLDTNKISNILLDLFMCEETSPYPGCEITSIDKKYTNQSSSD